MNKKILALCDSEADYVQSMAEYLRKKDNFLFELHTYTSVDKLLEHEQDTRPEILMVAESDYTDPVKAIPAKKIIVLNETGIPVKDVCNVNKYQKADYIYQKLSGEIAEITVPANGFIRKKLPAMIIGLYSPIKRCLQTSFALTLGQALAENNKVLYLSFEHYAGWNQLLEKNVKGDLAALLYFLDKDDEQFLHYLKSFTLQVGKLEYIPPVYAGQNLIFTPVIKWQELLTKIAMVGGYDYLILDLSENIQGTFELLKMCEKIYTIIKEDERALGKVRQYEDLLREYELEEVLQKTTKQVLPEFSRIPERIEQFTRGELADYIRHLVTEELLINDE